MAISLRVEQIVKLKNAVDNKERINFIQSFKEYVLNIPSAIKAYHDVLLFYYAFAYNKELVDLIKAEFKRIAEATKAIYNQGNKEKQTALMASGIVNTELLCSYSRSISQWLITKFPENVELDCSAASNDDIINIFPLFLPGIEYEVATQRKLSLNTRIKQASGLQAKSDQLKWLLQIFNECQLPGKVKDELYNQLKIFIRWKLKDEQFNRTFIQLPVKKFWYQKSSYKKIIAAKIIRKEIVSPVVLSAADKQFLLDTMKASLSFYYRETDPVSFADESELELFDMGRGLQIALAGMTKEKRLSLESYIGYMTFKNGVPVSYGGGWIWGNRCKIGVNMYPPFRRGESAWIFCQVIRLYYQYFGSRHFLVKPYQYGKGNPEGLKSGAFWFYYKLGFRPSNEELNKKAADEWDKINSQNKYRTPVKTLQQFTSANLEWKTNIETTKDFDPAVLSLAISKLINKNYNGSRKKAIAVMLVKWKKELRLLHIKSPSLYKNDVLENWCLLLGLLGDLNNWSLLQKKKLIQLVRLKQRGKERNYILAFQKHTCLRMTLQRIAEKFSQSTESDTY